MRFALTHLLLLLPPASLPPAPGAAPASGYWNRRFPIESQWLDQVCCMTFPQEDPRLWNQESDRRL